MPNLDIPIPLPVTPAGLATVNLPSAFPTYWAGKPLINTGRGSNYVFATSDASVTEKAQADAILPGANDEAPLQAVINAASGGRVRILGHSVNIQTADLTIANCVVEGTFSQAEDGTYAFSEATGVIIFLGAARKIQINRGGALHNVGIHTPSGSGVQVGSLTQYIGNPLEPPLSQVYLWSDTTASGTAVKIEYVAGAFFGPIQIRGFNVGLHLYAQAGAPNSFTNSNVIPLNVTRCPNPLKLENNGGSGVDSNVFPAYMFQPSAAGVQTAIQVIGGVRNQFPNVSIWDWDHATFGAAIKFDANSHQNHVDGFVPFRTGEQYDYMISVDDLGAKNTIDPVKAFERTYRAWIDPAHQTETLFRIYGVYISVEAAWIEVYQAFNSDGTDLISIGTDANKVWLVNNVDVSTIGRKAAALLFTTEDMSGSDYTIKAFYTPGGTQPTTGKAAVYVRVRY